MFVLVWSKRLEVLSCVNEGLWIPYSGDFFGRG